MAGLETRPQCAAWLAAVRAGAVLARLGGYGTRALLGVVAAGVLEPIGLARITAGRSR
jgi:hypothetical protein